MFRIAEADVFFRSSLWFHVSLYAALDRNDSSAIKAPWTKEEDEKVKQLVEKYVPEDECVI